MVLRIIDKYRENEAKKWIYARAFCAVWCGAIKMKKIYNKNSRKANWVKNRANLDTNVPNCAKL